MCVCQMNMPRTVHLVVIFFIIVTVNDVKRSLSCENNFVTGHVFVLDSWQQKIYPLLLKSKNSLEQMTNIEYDYAIKWKKFRPIPFLEPCIKLINKSKVEN